MEIMLIVLHCVSNISLYMKINNINNLEFKPPFNKYLSPLLILFCNQSVGIAWIYIIIGVFIFNIESFFVGMIIIMYGINANLLLHTIYLSILFIMKKAKTNAVVKIDDEAEMTE